MGERAVLSLDTAKAFDSVEWSFLWLVMGFGLLFLSWIKLLYSNPRDSVLVNGFIMVHLSLLLIAIEPLAILLHSREKVALYADVLLFLGDTTGSIFSYFHYHEFGGDYSGLRIIWTKCVLMPVDVLSPSSYVSSTPLMVVECFKYLVMQISSDLKNFLFHSMQFRWWLGFRKKLLPGLNSHYLQ